MNSVPSCRAGQTDTASAAERQQDHQRLGPQHAVDHRAVDPDQEAVDRVLVLGDDPAARTKITISAGTSVTDSSAAAAIAKVLVKASGAEQPAFLRLQREDRHERHGDDQQAEEQRRSDLGGRLDQDRHPRLPGLGAFQMLVRVLDHHDRRVDHGADRDRDAAQTHDVGADPEEASSHRTPSARQPAASGSRPARCGRAAGTRCRPARPRCFPRAACASSVSIAA